MKRAYSYVRFSTAEQLKGKSLERQTEAARAYCKQHGLELDTELSLHDLGVSAFRGKNADTGALGAFLKAAHIGQVPKGSFLLIETFDRLSRESAYDAQLTLQNIIHAGVTVVTLMDGKQYSVSILRAQPFALIEAILLMARSHEESATKSKRVADAWQRKRDDISTGKMLTAIAPGWLRVPLKATDGTRGKTKVLPERAQIVRRIFAEFLDGSGRSTIAANLNRDRVPTFGGGRWWTGAYVRVILLNRAVIGEFQPHRVDHSNPLRPNVRVPDGEPIKDYWPAILDVKVFNKAQARLAATRGKRSGLTGGLKNILAGLARCPLCDGLMERAVKRYPQAPKLICSRARAGAGCKHRGVPVAAVETALAVGATSLVGDVPDTAADLRSQIDTLESERETLQRRIGDMAMLLTDTPSRTVAARIQQDEAECERIGGELEQLKAQLQYSGARRMRDRLTSLRSALQEYAGSKSPAGDPEDWLALPAEAVNAALRECFEKIVVDYQHTRLEMHWHHGQVTAIPYYVP